MPRLTRPAALPARVEVAIEVLGSRARVEIIRLLAMRGSATVAELMDEVGAAQTRIQGHLTALEQRGVVVADQPPGERRGRIVRWTVDHDRVDELLSDLGHYLRGG